jgi:hypothetical protein
LSGHIKKIAEKPLDKSQKVCDTLSCSHRTSREATLHLPLGREKELCENSRQLVLTGEAAMCDTSKGSSIPTITPVGAPVGIVKDLLVTDVARGNFSTLLNCPHPPKVFLSGVLWAKKGRRGVLKSEKKLVKNLLTKERRSSMIATQRKRTKYGK